MGCSLEYSALNESSVCVLTGCIALFESNTVALRSVPGYGILLGNMVLTSTREN